MEALGTRGGIMEAFTRMVPAPSDRPSSSPNVLQVTLRDLVGQRFNGYQLHRSLRTRDWDSSMLVVEKRSDDRRVHAHTRAGEWLGWGLYAAERVSGLQGLLSPLALTFPLRKCFRDADVVHWHLVYPHYVSLPLMPLLTHHRPTIWTLHDPWALTGHCVHPLDCRRWLAGCGQCPDLKRDFTVWSDTTSLVWNVKHRMYRRAPITLVVASRWMKSRVEASPLLSSHPCHVIPFGLDLETWHPLDRITCRSRLGIPPRAKVIAFRMPSGEKHRQVKGVPWLVEALYRLKPGVATHIMVFDDKGQLTALQDCYRIIELGWLGDEHRMAEALTAADVFVMPSLAESFGLMALEAMACGTAVIASEGTAMTELVRPPQAGLCVPPRDSAALAQALADLLGDDARREAMGVAGRVIVESEYSSTAYLESHIRLYEALADRQPSVRAGAC
jgi:glycosyltransferase involved in cell wall biosynthesis